MKILVACEFSGIVREAFRKRGHDAWSCDLLPSEIPSPYHIQDDVLNHLDEGWDMMIAHPPCTHLAVSGARWFTEGKKDWKLQRDAIEFVKKLMDAPIQRIAIENPVSVISTYIRKPDQIVNPYFFGDPVPKKTCLWLKGLPILQPTNIVQPEFVIGKRDGKKYSKVHYYTPNMPDRWKIRSRTFQGFANAMADQWGSNFTLITDYETSE